MDGSAGLERFAEHDAIPVKLASNFLGMTQLRSVLTLRNLFAK